MKYEIVTIPNLQAAIDAGCDCVMPKLDGRAGSESYEELVITGVLLRDGNFRGYDCTRYRGVSITDKNFRTRYNLVAKRFPDKMIPVYPIRHASVLWPTCVVNGYKGLVFRNSLAVNDWTLYVRRYYVEFPEAL